MNPRIERIPEKKLVGKRLQMSLSNNKTKDLWQSYMPLRKDIKNTIGTNLFSVQILNDAYFKEFNPHTVFEKWACAEVSEFDMIPDELVPLLIPGGLYAVFEYKGLSTDNSIFQYIFGTWLPNSIYELDQRPHFELLGEKYKNNDPNSEEEIWIPIKLK